MKRTFISIVRRQEFCDMRIKDICNPCFKLNEISFLPSWIRTHNLRCICYLMYLNKNQELVRIYKFTFIIHDKSCTCFSPVIQNSNSSICILCTVSFRQFPSKGQLIGCGSVLHQLRVVIPVIGIFACPIILIETRQ